MSTYGAMPGMTGDITFSAFGLIAIFANSTETDVKDVFTEMTLDEFDLAIMQEAESDFDAGRGAPIERVFAKVRRERSQTRNAR